MASTTLPMGTRSTSTTSWSSGSSIACSTSRVTVLTRTVAPVTVRLVTTRVSAFSSSV